MQPSCNYSMYPAAVQPFLLISHSNNTCRVSSFSLLHSSQTTEHCTWFCLS
jgi:hypothetical protein